MDDAIPLSTPIVTASGKVVDCIHVDRGTDVVVPIRCMNRSTSIWGPDAKEFVPERWLNNENGLTQRAKELQGFHHTLSFIDGPRTCLGKSFAVTEIKVGGYSSILLFFSHNTHIYPFTRHIPLYLSVLLDRPLRVDAEL